MKKMLQVSKLRKYHFNQIKGKTNVIINFIFLLVSIICIVPLILIIMVSLTSQNEINKTGFTLFPHQLTLFAYKLVIVNGSQLLHAYGITIFVVIVGTILSLFVMSMYAYVLSRSNFSHNTFFSFFVFFTLIFGGGLVPWVMVYCDLLKINGTIWILIIPYLINGWWVIILRTFMKTSIPEAVIESACIDGASEFRTFFSIVLPLCKAGLATVGLFAMLQYWNDYYLPLIFVNDSSLFNIQYIMYQTLSSIQFITHNPAAALAIANGAGQTFPEDSARMVVAVLSIGPIIFAYPFFQRYFIKGLTIGAVKG
jgi:putative aldouronate transport system permease protein